MVFNEMSRVPLAEASASDQETLTAGEQDAPGRRRSTPIKIGAAVTAALGLAAGAALLTAYRGRGSSSQAMRGVSLVKEGGDLDRYYNYNCDKDIDPNDKSGYLKQRYCCKYESKLCEQEKVVDEEKSSDAGTCCDTQADDICWERCSFWGDPHYGPVWDDAKGTPSDVEHMLTGAFRMAMSNGGRSGTQFHMFEAQSLQCPWGGRAQWDIVAALAFRLDQKVVVVSNGTMWVKTDDDEDFQEVTDPHYSGLKLEGDFLQENHVPGSNPKTTPGQTNFSMQSDDCCYRTNITVKLKTKPKPNFFFNLDVMIPASETDYNRGVCAVRETGEGMNDWDKDQEFSKTVTKHDILFPRKLMQDIFCKDAVCGNGGDDKMPVPFACSDEFWDSDKPEEPSPRATPAPPKEAQDACKEYDDVDDCKGDAYKSAEEACNGLSDPCLHECIVDYCESGCDSDMSDQARERCEVQKQFKYTADTRQECRATPEPTAPPKKIVPTPPPSPATPAPTARPKIYSAPTPPPSPATPAPTAPPKISSAPTPAPSPATPAPTAPPLTPAPTAEPTPKPTTRQPTAVPTPMPTGPTVPPPQKSLYCNLWGDPHITPFSGNLQSESEYDHYGIGIHRLARSKDRSFEVQVMQCPWSGRAGGQVVVAVAFAIEGKKIVLTDSSMYVDGTKVTEESKALMLIDNVEETGSLEDLAGMEIKTKDNMYSVWMKIKRKKKATPYFFFNVKVAMDESKTDQSAGMCGWHGGVHFNEEVEGDAMLFHPSTLQDVCTKCIGDRPAHCVTETYEDDRLRLIRLEADPGHETPALAGSPVTVHPCEDADLVGEGTDCPPGGETGGARHEAEMFCNSIEEDGERDACEYDFCFAGCDAHIAEDDKEQNADGTAGYDVNQDLGMFVVPGSSDDKKCDLTECPDGGLFVKGDNACDSRCWFFSHTEQSCSRTCEEHGLDFKYSYSTTPIAPQLYSHVHKEDDEPYKCLNGVENWEGSWSDSQKAWCCENKHIGCPFQAGTVPEFATQEAPWASLECFIENGHRWHTAKDADQEENHLMPGYDNPGQFRDAKCQLSCPCV